MHLTVGNIFGRCKTVVLYCIIMYIYKQYEEVFVSNIHSSVQQLSFVKSRSYVVKVYISEFATNNV